MPAEIALDEEIMTMDGVLRLSDLLRQAGHGNRVSLDTDPCVLRAWNDSRTIRPGDLYVAVAGKRDGADFAAEAVRAGAVAIVAASPDRNVGVPWIVVEHDRVALADLAAVAAGRPSERLSVTAVTGTNGKTTTVHVLESILSAGGTRVGAIGTVEARWPGHAQAASRTTPEAPQLQELLGTMERDGCSHVVLEASSHAIDLERLRATRFDALGFTNLTQDHLDWHGDMDAYFASKRRLFTELAPGAPAVIGADCPMGRALAAELRALDPGRRIVTTGFDASADLSVVDHRGDVSGAAFTLRGRASSNGLPVDVAIDVELRRPGRHDVENAALASGLALVLGVDVSQVALGLAAFRGVRGRLERVVDGGGSGVDVFVDYAHSPDGLEGVLRAAREFTKGRLICVFGCGGDRDTSKRAVMGRIVGTLADVAIATSDNPRNESADAILAMVEEGLAGTRADRRTVRDRRQAIEEALDLAAPGDVVIVAGKGHETWQEIGDRRIPFDDCVVVRDLWSKRSGGRSEEPRA